MIPAVGSAYSFGGGYPTMTLSVPTRYIHTVTETVHKTDLQSAIDLLAQWLGRA